MAASEEVGNLEASRRIFDAMVAKKPEIIDELVSHEYESHALWRDAFVPEHVGGSTWFDRIRHQAEHDNPNFTDPRLSIDQQIAGQDKVVTVFTSRAKRDGKTVVTTYVTIDRFSGGKLVESWEMYDRLGLYEQLGVSPSSRELYEKAGTHVAIGEPQTEL